jgi:hypothetical protein
MKKNFARKKRNIKRETRKEIKEKYSRKPLTQEKTIPHVMKIMIMTMNHKEFSSWQWKLRKKPPKVTKKVT